MDPLITAGLIVTVLALAWIWTKNSTVAQTPAGGVAVANSPNVTTPIPSNGVKATVATVTPITSHPIKTIKIIKDTSGPTVGPSFVTIGDVYAYTVNKKLLSSDYSDIVMFPPDSDNNTNISTLTLTLRTPHVLTKIEVLNRQDCCIDRLAGAKIVLIDADGHNRWSGTFTGSKELRLFPITGR